MNEEDTKVADIFEKDIENFGNNLDKMIEHLNIVITAHNKQVEEIERLNNIINELEKYIEEELDRLARETSNIYEDSLGKTRLVNENIYEELQKIKDKLQELKGSDKE